MHYRYIYRDGEVTPLSPFSEPAFFPGPYKLNREQGSLTSFKNVIEEVDIMFNPGSEEVVEVEIWLSKGLGRPIKSLVSINKANEGIASSTPYVLGTGKFTYNNNKTYRTLPTDQANYIFSDIPVTAKALEFVGNRLVLGNYVRNYSLTKVNEEGGDITPKYFLDIDLDRSTLTTNGNIATKSLKSDREYEIGIVYLDREGRQSSVIISKENRTRVDWTRHNLKTALKLEIKSSAPYWATHYRIFYKDVVGRFENIYPKRVVVNDGGDRLYVQLNKSDINKVGPNTRFTYKGNGNSVETAIRREFVIDPYSANAGRDGGFRLEEDSSGNLSLDSSTAAQNFFVPFDVVADHTGQTFTQEWYQSSEISLPLDIANKPIIVKPNGFMEHWEDLNINTIVVEGSNIPIYKVGPTSIGSSDINTPLWDWNQSDRSLTLYEGFYERVKNTSAINDDMTVVLTATYIDRTSENSESEYQFIALAPREEGDLALFVAAEEKAEEDFRISIGDNNPSYLTPEQIEQLRIYFNGLGLGSAIPFYSDNESTIFETVDDDIGALEDSLYYEWGQTFRCVNGAHTTSQNDIIMIDDRVQLLYEQKATGLSVSINDESTLGLTQVSTDLDSGTYDVFWIDDFGTKQNRRGVTYTKATASEGVITFPIPISIGSNITFTITDAIPEFYEDGTPTGLEIGDSVEGNDGSITIPLSYYNCFSYPNGVEEIKIRSNFNAETLSPGIRASTVNESYRRRNQIAHLIHSGIFNDDINLNRLNEFNRSNQIEWELEINNGSIQHLHARDTNLVVFQENKVKNVPINKNLIQTAGGQLSTTRSNNFFNTERSYEGEFGISKNPESFATYGNRMYFSDKDRGALLRLVGNVITEISQQGTEAYVRDVLGKAELVICSYDDNRDAAHFSFRNRPPQPNTSTNVFNREFIISVNACPDPRATCNIVLNPDRDAADIPSMRVYSLQDVEDIETPPLYGLAVGDALKVDPERKQPVVGDSRFYLLFHEAMGAIGSESYIPPNNIALQISADGIIEYVEENCIDNRPVDLARQLFGISVDTFSTPIDACANGSVECRAYHDGRENRSPEQGDTIYAGRYDTDPLYITDYKLVIDNETKEKYVIRLENGVVRDEPILCSTLSLGRTPILGSHPILIPFGTNEADRNVMLCEAPFAEEVYWFDAESQLPELTDQLFDNDNNNHLVYGPWDATINYVALEGSGQYVSHNDILWKREETVVDTASTTTTEGITYKILTVAASDWTSVSELDDARVGDIFVATTSLNSAALALLGTIALYEPSFDNPTWKAESGNVYITFENGYFAAIGKDGGIITYGTCSEVLCFKTPEDLIIPTPNGGPYDFTFPGIEANYTVSTTGTQTEILSQLSPIRGAELNYVVLGDEGRYPETGSSQINAENQEGDVFYSPVFDTSAPRETRDNRDLQVLFLEAGSTFTLPIPSGAEAETNPFIRITSLCYRGLAFNSVGDPLDIIPPDPVISSLIAVPPSAQINNEIVITGTASSEEGSIVSYQWFSVDSNGDSVAIDSNLTVTDSITNQPTIGLNAVTTEGTYTLRLLIMDSNLNTSFRDIPITFTPINVDAPVVTIFTDGVDVETKKVVRENDVILTATAVPVDSSNTINSWTWTLDDDVTLVSGDLTGTTPEVGSITVGSNVATTPQNITLYAADTGTGSDTDLVAVEWTANADDARIIRQVFLSATALTTGADRDAACKGTGTNSVYYDANETPIKYFTTSSLLDNQVFQGGDGDWGASINVDKSVQGGAALDFIQTIGNDGLISAEAPVVCAAPYGPFDFGFIPLGSQNDAAYVTACASKNTPAYIDQPATNFGGASEADRAKVIYTRKMDGTISLAPDGFWVYGDHIIQATNGVLSVSSVPYGCSRSATFNADGGSATGSSTDVDITDGSDTVNIGEDFEAIASIKASPGFDLDGSVSWIATGGGQVDDSGTGTSVPYAGTATDAGTFTRTITFDANTKAATSAGLSATLNASSPSGTSLSFTGDGTGTSNRVTGGLTDGDGFNMSVAISPTDSTKQFSSTPSFTLSGARTGSSTGESYNYVGSIGSVSQSTTVTWSSVSLEDIPVTYKATLNASLTSDSENVKLSFSGVNSGTNAYVALDKTDYDLSASIEAIDSTWTVTSADSNATLKGTFNGANVSSTAVTLKGIARRPSFSTVGQGSTAAASCSGGGSLFGVAGGQLYSSATSSSDRSAIYYRVGETVYYWNGSGTTTTQTAEDICLPPDRPSIGNVGFDSSDSSNACTVDTTEMWGDSSSLATTTAIYDGPEYNSDTSASGIYSQSGKVRAWNKTTSSLGTSGDCPPVLVGTISIDDAAHTANNGAGDIDVVVTYGGDATGFTVTEAAFTPAGWSITSIPNPPNITNPKSFSYTIDWTDYNNGQAPRSGKWVFTENASNKPVSFTLTQNA